MATPSGTSGSRTYWTYASSRTTRQSPGTRSRNASNSARCTTVPVGLFGLQTKIRQVGQVRIGLKRPPREEDLRAGLAHRLQQLLRDADRPAADGHVRLRHAESVGNRPGQLGGGVVRVPVDMSGRVGQHRPHRGEWVIRGFVGRKLEGPARLDSWRLARFVPRELVQYLPEPG